MATYVVDVETYIDYFLVLFKRVGSTETVAFELYEGQELEIDGLKSMMEENLTIGFNSNSYDLFMISAAINGKSNEELKRLSDKIIMSDRPAWMIAGKHDCEIPKKAYGGTLWNHIDIINVAPGQASLKIYGGRINAPKMQDLPIDPSASISPTQREELRTYCLNDLETTELLYTTLSKQLKLRRDMSKQYKMDLRSKSDAQIAEAVFRKEIGQLDGRQVLPPKRIDRTKTYRYLNPKIIEFRSDDLIKTLYAILDTEFTLTEKASIQLPKWLSEKKIEIGGSKYQMGIGGLHSCEKKRHIICDGNHVLRDADVASYYPSIILQQGLIPENIGKGFVDVYTNIYETRLAAKASGDKVTADSLKITLNGSFGKLGSRFSALYAPDLLIQTTITGQLSLLMLIEMLEDKGISVVSANTDGIVVHFNKSLQRTYEEVCWDWEIRTSYELEFTDYRALYSRDVNSYIAIKPDGSIKGKGAFADPTLMKNPQFVIINDAIKAHLAKGTPIESTVMACQDVTKFLMVRNVTGGAVWNDEYLGKAVRFYYSNAVDAETCIRYAKNGNKVPISDGAVPMMQLTEKVPKDMDRVRYIRMAKEALKDFGL
jgi:DNA polymerase elongation subunit (family B)